MTSSFTRNLRAKQFCVSIRVLQRKKTNRRYIEREREREREIDLSWELAHVIIKAEKSHGLLSASCRTRKASGAVQLKPDSPVTRNTREEKIDVPAQIEKRSHIPPSSAFLFYPGPQRIG